MSNNEGYFNAIINLGDSGDFIIDNKDVQRCYWIEDIFTYSMVGKLTIIDRYGLKEFGPITGDETVKVLYGMDSPQEQEFSIFSISRTSNINSKDQTSMAVIDIIFCDSFFSNLILKKYSKSYNKTKISDIVKDIWDNLVGGDSTEFKTFEATNEEINYCMPYCTPAEAIRWLLPRASGSNSQGPGYLLYSNSNGLYFQTLESLLQSTTKDSNNYVFECSNPYYINKILSWTDCGTNNMGFKDIAGVNIKGYDSSQKKMIKEEFVYSDAVKKVTSLGNKTLFTNKVDFENCKVMVLAEPKKDILKNIAMDSFIKTYSQQNAVKIIVTGHESRYAGMLIELEWPSQSKKEMYNISTSGKYLVKSITTCFQPGQQPYIQQKLVCLKNAYENSYDTDLVPAGQSNTYTEEIALGTKG
jgi:hypothetical protein